MSAEVKIVRASGPRHEPDCLGLVRTDSPTGAGYCACPRRDWLAEQVPRGQARAELLDQLARWAHEQRIFTESEIASAAAAGGGAAILRPARRAAGLIAHDIWISVRMGALNLAKECTPHLPRETSGPTSAEDVERTETVATAGGVL